MFECDDCIFGWRESYSLEEKEIKRFVARGRSGFVGRATRGDDKPRGCGRGRRNRNLIPRRMELFNFLVIKTKKIDAFFINIIIKFKFFAF